MDVAEAIMALTEELKERGCYEQYTANTANDSNMDIIEIANKRSTAKNPSSILENSFFWEESPEGDMFWRDIHLELLEKYGTT